LDVLTGATIADLHPGSHQFSLRFLQNGRRLLSFPQDSGPADLWDENGVSLAQFPDGGSVVPIASETRLLLSEMRGWSLFELQRGSRIAGNEEQSAGMLRVYGQGVHDRAKSDRFFVTTVGDDADQRAWIRDATTGRTIFEAGYADTGLFM